MTNRQSQVLRWIHHYKLANEGVDPTRVWIASKLDPVVTPATVGGSVKKLKEQGLLAKVGTSRAMIITDAGYEIVALFSEI